MLSKSRLAFVGALAVLGHGAFAAAAPRAAMIEPGAPLPSANIESACRDAQAAALPDSRSVAFKSCVRDERAAYEKLRQEWPHFSAEARRTCAEPADGVPFSYVELLTCLEMQPGGSLNRPTGGSGGLNSVDTTPPMTPSPPAMTSPSPQRY